MDSIIDRIDASRDRERGAGGAVTSERQRIIPVSDAIGVPAANQLNEYFGGSGSLIVTVPEPTSGLLMFAGLSSLLGVRRLRRGRR